ncbi:angiomotin-like protein 1 isoform X2 [Dendronephthya gigantea]|uniref:angiomotin-like protein 1 isoform X2 n=1 Tax=Dendronephthya gigantea TaxID=151771 RepID=UPI00106A1E0F|nr:angiomotin-like protein 1 isoform X2 [Dendronephthya gigantea]
MALVSQIDMFPKRIKNIFTPGVRMSDTEAKRAQDGLDNKSSTGMLNTIGHDSRASSGLEDDEVASRATQIVQVISEENMCLRKQLEKYYQEIKKLKCVDKELRDTHIMYKDLKTAFITREHKEKAMRLRMEAEIAQLQKTNTELTDEMKELQTVLGSEPKRELQGLKDEINQRDDEVKQLQKDRKNSKSSLQNLERILKQKSSEIILLRQQLEMCVCNVCGSKQMKEERENKNGEKETSADYLEQFHESMMKSSGRYRTRFLNKSNQRLCNTKEELDINTCVPVLVELLKEKDAEIVKLRAEIDQIMSRLSEMSVPEWTSSVSERRLHKHRQSKQRYSDLETEIRSLHVKLAEKDAQIKILQCKYGENRDSSSPSSTPFRIPSFTSQSSLSSYQDSGVMTASDGHCEEATYQNAKDDGIPERYQLRLQEPGYDIETDGRHSDKQEEEGTCLSDHCWFV